MNKINKALRKVYDIICSIASKLETKTQYWFFNNDIAEGSYCYDCGSEKLLQLKKAHQDEEIILMGVNCESDSQEFCVSCGVHLDNTFTTYACECELDYFEENGFNKNLPEDCYYLLKILDSCGWDYSSLSERIKALCRKFVLNKKIKT